jgi:hypothetical protein
VKLIPAILAFTVTALAADPGDVSLSWNPSPTPGVTNYTLYAKTSATNIAVNTGTICTATLRDIKAGIYTFTATAWKDGTQSVPCIPLVVEIAEPPVGLRTVVVAGAPILSSTNWVDMGFFKLKIP